MAVPYTFGSATSAIPLSQLDSNFATTITLGNTAIQLGNTVTTLNNMTLANVTVSSVASAITVAQGGTGQTTLTTAYGVLCAGTTATGAVQTLNSLGTSGQVLTSNGAAALPSFQAIPSVSGASLVFIQSQTASSSATLNFTTGINSTYDHYIFDVFYLLPATNSSLPYVRVSTDGGSTWDSGASAYGYESGYVAAGSAGASSSSGAAQIVVSGGNGVGSNSARGFSGQLHLFSPSDTSHQKQFTWQFVMAGSSGRAVAYGGAIYLTNTNAINGIQFLFDSGNITSGTIVLYGVKKS